MFNIAIAILEKDNFFAFWIHQYYFVDCIEIQNYKHKQERFYTRAKLRGIRISRLDKIPTLYYDLLRSLN